MRVLLVGAPTSSMQRISRIFREHGWQTVHRYQADSPTFLPPADLHAIETQDVLLIEDTQWCRTMVNAVRALTNPPLLLLFGPRDRMRSAQWGADDVIHPGDDGDLTLERIHALLRLKRSRWRDHYRFGDLVIDLVHRRVRRGNRQILLSHREFQLLSLLAEDAGNPVLRSRMIDRLWPDDPDIGDNSVDAIASRLRRRLDGLHQDKLIQTVRGVGYCLRIVADETGQRLAS